MCLSLRKAGHTPAVPQRYRCCKLGIDISGHYNRIPLHLMAGYAKNKKIVFLPQLDLDEAVPGSLGNVKDKIQAYVSQHDGLGVRTSEAKHWHDNTEFLRKLRHDYFHFSAKIKWGHTPRIEHGERIRQVHRG